MLAEALHLRQALIDQLHTADHGFLTRSPLLPSPALGLHLSVTQQSLIGFAKRGERLCDVSTSNPCR